MERICFNVSSISYIYICCICCNFQVSESNLDYTCHNWTWPLNPSIYILFCQILLFWLVSNLDVQSAPACQYKVLGHEKLKEVNKVRKRKRNNKIFSWPSKHDISSLVVVLGDGIT